MSKHLRFGHDDEFMDLFSFYVNGGHQHVNFCGYLSNTICVFSDVTSDDQRSALGPLLILIFINDLPAIFLDSITSLLADDCSCSLAF